MDASNLDAPSVAAAVVAVGPPQSENLIGVAKEKVFSSDFATTIGGTPVDGQAKYLRETCELYEDRAGAPVPAAVALYGGYATCVSVIEQIDAGQAPRLNNLDDTAMANDPTGVTIARASFGLLCPHLADAS